MQLHSLIDTSHIIASNVMIANYRVALGLAHLVGLLGWVDIDL